jgi:glycosyltransferase involved in cell wall biosynthesis/MoaA/NifB/PqqE/SkfB family radical SAM enzyme
MKILQVIHGYPARFNAGSEIYTQALAHGLADRHEVRVFTRQEDPYQLDYAMADERDALDPRVRLHLVNQPHNRDRYRFEGVDARFAEVLDAFNPDIVHIGHLNHLSTSLVAEAARRSIPIVFTLHDFWLMCPRGQFMQIHPSEGGDIFPLCDGQEDRKCAVRCYTRCFGGGAEHVETDISYWTGWVRERMTHVRRMAEHVALFVAPSQYIFDRFRNEFGLPKDKLVHLDYGFDIARLSGRRRVVEDGFTFGYIGTHRPAKGIHQLIDAFGCLRGNARLRIWGRPNGEFTTSIRAHAAALPSTTSARIEWMQEFQNHGIVRDVFDHVDAIVVPSIWPENSPLVIHEALQARVPVVTADFGGMSERIHHEVNGLLFRHRDSRDLADQMQRLVDDPEFSERIGTRGYLQSADGNVLNMREHVRAMEAIYEHALGIGSDHSSRSGPWRITFDTNPDDCNLHCIMCEEHSPHSPLQVGRREAGIPNRRMDIALIRRVLEERRGTPLREIIPSTMGEPLVYAHFDEIIDLCREFGVKLNLTTNGTFPGRGAREWAHRIVPVASDVKISWNGARPETAEAIMVGLRWEKVLANVREFIAVRDEYVTAGANRCRVTFQLTFLESNVSELADIVRLAASLGVDRVKGHHLWAHFDQIKSLSMRRNPVAITRWNLAVREARQAADECLLPSGARVQLENFYELEPGATHDIAPGGPCPFLAQEAWVAFDGRFSPCCAPDAERRMLGDFGSVAEGSIGEIWASDHYQRLCSNYVEHDLCRSCNMRRPVKHHEL